MLKEIQFNEVVFATDSPGNFLKLNDDVYFFENPVIHFRPGAFPWRMNHLMLAFCWKGWLRGRVDMEECRLEADSFVLLLPKRFVELQEISPDFEVTIITLSNEFAQSLNFGDTFREQLAARPSPCHVLNQEGRFIVSSYLRCIKPLLTSDERFTYRLEIARLLTRALVLSLASLARRVPSLKDSNRQANLVRDFVNLVADNYRTHREMDFYADRMCLTAKYITATVKAQSGRSATDWIERYVVLDAQTLLTSTDMTILQISQELHFPSQSFFGKYFKRVTGVSPKDYRRASHDYAL